MKLLNQLKIDHLIEILSPFCFHLQNVGNIALKEIKENLEKGQVELLFSKADESKKIVLNANSLTELVGILRPHAFQGISKDPLPEFVIYIDKEQKTFSATNEEIFSMLEKMPIVLNLNLFLISSKEGSFHSDGILQQFSNQEIDNNFSFVLFKDKYFQGKNQEFKIYGNYTVKGYSPAFLSGFQKDALLSLSFSHYLTELISKLITAQNLNSRAICTLSMLQDVVNKSLSMSFD